MREPVGVTRDRRAAPAALVTLTLLLGCGTTAHPSAPGAAVRVSALAAQNRFDEVDPGHFEIAVTNEGPSPFTVTSVRLDSPGFAPVPASLREEPFPAATRYDLPALFGAALCDRSPEPATAVVELHADGGPPATVRVPLASPDGLLRHLHDQDCDRQDLARQVTVTLTDVVGHGLDATAGIRVQRLASRASVTVTELRDSKLFALTAALPAQLPATGQTLELPVVVRVAGCYGHLLADVKQPYLFPVFLSFDGGPPRYAEVASGPEQHAQLQALLRTACAGRTS